MIAAQYTPARATSFYFDTHACDGRNGSWERKHVRGYRQRGGVGFEQQSQVVQTSYIFSSIIASHITNAAR